MTELKSIADRQGLLAHRLHQIEDSLNEMDTRSPARMDVVEMYQDFWNDADVQLRQLCNRANKLRKQLDKIKQESEADNG